MVKIMKTKLLKGILLNDVKIPVLCFSRVSGYYAPTSHFNLGKKEEFSERKMLNIQEFIDDNKKTADVP